MKGLLLVLVSSWKDLLDTGKVGAQFTTWLTPLMTVLTSIMWVALALVGAAGGLYAVYVGIKMARADSSDAREENKKRLINIILTIVAVIALILVFNVFLPMIIGAFVDDSGNFIDPSKNSPDQSSQSAISTVVNTVRCLIGR